MKKRFGFTLVEVMVVLVIIAVLATAGISSYSWYITEARSLDIDNFAYDLDGSINEFKSSHGRSPTANELATLMPPASETRLAHISIIPRVFAATTESQTLYDRYPGKGRTDCKEPNGNKVPCRFSVLFLSNGEHMIIYGQLSKKRLQNYHTYTVTTTNGTQVVYGPSIGKSGLISTPETDITPTVITNYGTSKGIQNLSVNIIASPVEQSENPNTTIPEDTTPPITTPPLPEPETTIPVTTGPGPWTEPETTEPGTTSDYYYPTTSWGEESTTDIGTTSDYYYPTTSWGEESTTDIGTTSDYYYPTTSWGETTSDYATTSWEATTSEIPPTTGGYTCRYDDQCAVDEYCDDSASVNQGFLSSLWSWIIQSNNGICQSLSLLPSSSDTSNIPVSTYAGGGMCRVDSDCFYGYKCVGAWWDIFNWFGGTCAPESEFGDISTTTENYTTSSEATTDWWETTSWSEETTTEYTTDTWGETTSWY